MWLISKALETSRIVLRYLRGFKMISDFDHGLHFLGLPPRRSSQTKVMIDALRAEIGILMSRFY